MRLPGFAFYPAHPSNYTPGRNRALAKFTVHHSAGWEATLRHLWADPARNGSSTLWVGNQPGALEQYVDTNDTPWTNGNFASNSESITCETRGDWRGYYDQQTLNNLEQAMYECLKIWPHLKLEFHMDVTTSPGGTLCPAELKHKGHAAAAWNRAKARLAAPAPAPQPAPSKITYKPIPPKRVRLNKVTNLWDFNFTDWSKARSVNPAEFANGYPEGKLIDVVAEATNALGAKYYMTAWAYDEGRIRSTHGFNVKDAPDYVPAPIPQPQPGPVPPVEPPKPVPTWEAMATPRELLAKIDLWVINLDNGQRVGDMIPAGKPIAFVEKINTDKVYFRSKWARDNAKNWGIPFDQLEEKKDPVNEPIPEKPIDTDPTTPGEGDVLVRLNAIERFLTWLFGDWKNRK